MVAAIPQIVVFDDLLDAHKTLFARLYLLDQLPKVAVRLAATALDLVNVVAVSWYELDDDLVGNKVLPVCASFGTPIVKHELGVFEVLPALGQQVLDLAGVSGRMP